MSTENTSNTKPTLVCFGEVLWDMLPDGKVAGGAPMNVAFHANNLGLETHLISAVGKDNLGAALLDFLSSKSISTKLVQELDSYPTSTVEVTLNESGSASYEIVHPVAWDAVVPEAAQIEAVENADLFLFGSLACRNEISRSTLLQILDKVKTSVFDVNLRPPFYSKELLETLLHKANIVKVNDEELDILTSFHGIQNDINAQMKCIAEQYNVDMVILTLGKEGAFVLNQGILYQQTSFPIKVRDTVGAGDSFLAAFLTNILLGKPISESLEFAAATGAIVATKAGGTPVVEPSTVRNFILEYS